MKNYKGLTDQQVAESRTKHGTNAIPEPEPTTFWQAFKETFGDPMIRILLVIAAIMIAMFCLGYAEIYESVGIIVAILIVATISAKTSVASDTKYRELKDSQEKDKAKVYRNGKLESVPFDELVVGDYILLQSGDKIPADGILVDGKLKVNNSALNGETEECPKTPAPEDAEFPEKLTGDTFVDSSSLFKEAIVYDGEGVMLVKKVGIQTMMGKMALEMQEDDPDSPLKVKLSKLAKQISTFGYVGATLIAIVYMISFIVSAGNFLDYLDLGWQQVLRDVLKAVSLGATIIVCAVPEGLPLMISLVLMQNTKRMLDHNVLVRKAIGIETAGGLNILFSDKTGTITKGFLEVVEFFTTDLETEGHSPEVLHKFNVSVVKNTQANFDENGNILGGNLTDQALARYITKEGFDDINSISYTVTGSQGFNSANKFSQAYITGSDAHCGYTYYKGAPEKLVEAAKYYISKDGNTADLTDEVKNKLNEKINALADNAMRVLAFGCSSQRMIENKIHDDLALIGFVAIRDDVRPEAKEAIGIVQEAGVQVVMITGDRINTAKAIAKDAGLIKSEDDLALTSAELNEMSDDEVKEIVPRIRVIARALPTDKSRMVRLCQELNLVTGMTGDGVNDSPALKKADVGFAMGSGTEAAKEAAEVVILDDNFKSIKDAIWYGRTIYNNILKFCIFQLVINVAAVFISAISPFIGIDEPLKVTHLLFVNLVMDGLGAAMLGNEPALLEYLKEKPRRRDESIISREMASRILGVAVYVIVASIAYLKIPQIIDLFPTPEQHLTGYFLLFILIALMNGFNVRDKDVHIFKQLGDNPDFIKIMGTIIMVQLCIIYAGLIPFAPFQFISKMFSCEPITSVTGLITIVFLAVLVIPFDLIRKSVLKAFNKN